jgi:hypothetical protein
MIEYLQEIVEEFPFDLSNKAVTPAGPHLFDKDEDSILLDNEKSKISMSIKWSQKSYGLQ